MKKTLLLGVAASMLSFSAMNVNAETTPSNTAELELRATFVNPLEMLSEKYLGFGVILADEGGKKVVVTPKGELGEGSDATMMSTASYANYYKDGQSTDMSFTGALNAGLVRVKNISGYDYGVEVIKVTLSDESVDLIAMDDSTVCGVVDAFETEVSVEGDDALIHVGGRLTTADLSHTTSKTECYSKITLTLVLDGDVIAAAANEWLEVN